MGNITKNELLRELEKLIVEFKEGDYWKKNEIQIQTDFTLPLLGLLGWDKLHRDIDPNQEVDTGQRPDILLKNEARSTVLIIESKKAQNKDVLEKGYYGSGKNRETFEEQLFRYCKSEGKYWGLLTNFVEWRLYNSHQQYLFYEKPHAFHDLLWDNADKSKYIDLLSDEGLDFLLGLRKESLWEKGGKFDKRKIYYPDESEIREEFFENISNWRASLFEYLTAKYCKKHDETEIDLGTQRILDRMIFIEVCTDREVVAGDSLNAIRTTRKSFYDELKKKFARFDELFNAGLFADNWIDHIEVDNGIIEPIIIGISGIDFNSLSVNVIGEVYEEYIGKELQKKSGAYYTPEYIVDYIVENTVGELLKDAKREEDIRKIKVLDPACGSGSFLIKTFDAFMEAYRQLDVKKKRAATPGLFDRDRLISILRDNIYGVDIDARAVEIAKLNLLIKALEGARYDNISGTRLLPDLSLNIRVGNSLIGGEQLGGDEEEGQTWLFDDKYRRDKEELLNLRRAFAAATSDAEKAKILADIEWLEAKVDMDLNERIAKYFEYPKTVNAFNYTVTFPEVFAVGGFDAVIGNPPYIDSELMTKEQPEIRDFISRSGDYEFTKGNWDIYIAFLERAYRLVKRDGYWSYITPDKWISKGFGKTLRFGTLDYICILLNVGRDVFKNSKIDAIVSVYRKKSTEELKVFKYLDGSFVNTMNIEKINITPPYRYDFLFSRWLRILSKVEKASERETVNFFCDNACGTSDAYKLKPLIINLKEKEFNKVKYYKIINTGTIGRYVPRWGFKEMTYLDDKYLKPVCDQSEFRKEFTGSYGSKVDKPKIIIKGLTLLDCCLDLDGYIIPGKSTIITYSDDNDTLKFISAIINSKLAIFYISEKYPASSYNKGINFTKDMIQKFPIPQPTVDFLRIMVKLVDKIIPLQYNFYSEKDENIRVELDIDIHAINSKIDDLVYELYGLTDEEIAIVDGEC